MAETLLMFSFLTSTSQLKNDCKKGEEAPPLIYVYAAQCVP